MRDSAAARGLGVVGRHVVALVGAEGVGGVLHEGVRVGRAIAVVVVGSD